MKLLKCKICGGNQIRIVHTDDKTQAVCLRCGNAGKPVYLNEKQVRLLSTRNAKTQEVADELAVERWNNGQEESHAE